MPIISTLILAIVTQTESDQEKFDAEIRAVARPFHERAVKSQFVTNLFGQSLTKQQYLVHLEQRALVFDEILKGFEAFKSNREIYSLLKKNEWNTLKLLKSDLKALGSSSKGDLKQLRATEENEELLALIRATVTNNEPWKLVGFLSLFHGGTQNGGRRIGAKAAEVLGASNLHYGESLGYFEFYDRMVKSACKKPKARADILDSIHRGYEAVIKVNNSVPFQAVASPATKG